LPPLEYRQAPAAPIQKILEREMHLLTRVSEKIPTPARHRPPADGLKTAATKALAEEIPQTFAKILQAERELRGSRVVLKPSKGSPVESLMQVARAVRAGRLPFVPRETKKRAHELLSAVKRHRTGSARVPSVNQLIERHKLIPLAIQHQLTKNKEMTAPQHQMHRVVSERMKLTPAEARKLSTVIPRFEDTGALVGSGPAIIDSGESRTRVGEADTFLGPESGQGYEAPASPTHESAPSSPTAPPALGAPNHSSSALAGESKTSGGLGGSTGGGTVGAGGSGATKISGELTIAGLAQWIAKIEGEMRGA
jgi:hypothetical protein